MNKWGKTTLIGCRSFLMLAICIGIGGFFFLRHLGRSFFMLGIEDFDEAKQPWMECGIPHPSGTPEIVFMQKSIHPFLAEYEYKLRFGSGTNAVERWLPLNCGGRTRMNAYWYPSDGAFGSALRLQDHWGEYLVRIQEQKTYLILRYKGRIYAGEITESSPGSSMGETYCPKDGVAKLHVSVGRTGIRSVFRKDRWQELPVAFCAGVGGSRS
ncbi:MAG: hypothetical protein ACOX9C_06545 [Kiritimatiellia bacterium]|jgi:hypothetical protein